MDPYLKPMTMKPRTLEPGWVTELRERSRVERGRRLERQHIREQIAILDRLIALNSRRPKRRR